VIDLITGQRIVVLIDSVYGPYVRVSSYQDAGALEDILDEKYYVPYWTKAPVELRDAGGCEYYFGLAADPEKLQKILDDIEFD